MRVGLESPLPAELAVGDGHRAVRGRDVLRARASRWSRSSLLVDGEEQPLGAFGMPRLDDAARATSPTATAAASGASRGSARAPVAGWRSRAAASTAARRRTAALGRDPAAAPSRGAASRADGPRSRSAWRPTTRRSTCSARQLDSIRAQTHARLGLRDQRRLLAPGALRRDRGGARRTTRASCSRARRGGSASTATSSARSRWRRPAPRYVALADQDDAWHPDKLATLLARARRRPARLQRRARRRRATARVLADTYWSRAHATTTPTCSRCWSPTRSPAPPRCSARDAARRRAAVPARASSRTSTTTGSRSWRSSLGDIAFVDRPLYDYVQHGDATLGHAAANRMPALRERARGALRRDPRERIRLWRMHYFVDVCRLLQFADGAAAALRRADAAAPSAARSSASLRADRSLRRAGRLAAARRARAASGRPRDARRRVDARPRASPGGGCWPPTRARRARRAALRLDALPPPASTRGRARRAPADAGRARDRREDRAAASWRVARRRAAARQPADPDDRPRSTSSAATSRKFNLARRLAERGRARADRHRRPGRRRCRATGGATSRPTAAWPGCFDEVEVAFGRESRRHRGQPRRPLHRHDLVDRAHRRTPRCARSTASASST